MHGDLTRSKSNKGAVDGQFSHEFLHRPVWESRFVRLCADRAVRVQPYQAAESLYSAHENFDGSPIEDKPSLSCYLACLVHLVSLMQPNKPADRIEQINKTGWQTFSASCYSGTRISIQGGLSSTMSENRRAVLLAGNPGKMAPRRI